MRLSKLETKTNIATPGSTTGQTTFFSEAKGHRIELDATTQLVTISVNEARTIIPVANVRWMVPAEVEATKAKK